MAPRLVDIISAVIPAVWVVLIEQVILTVIEDQPVGVIDPPAARREMELRTESFFVQLVLARERVIMVDGAKSFTFLIDSQGRRFALELAHVQEHPKIRSGARKRNFELTYDFAVNNKAYQRESTLSLVLVPLIHQVRIFVRHRPTGS